MRWRFSSVSLVALTLTGLAMSASAELHVVQSQVQERSSAPGRPYTVDQMAQIERLGEGRLSPDGTVFVFERIHSPDQGAELGPDGVPPNRLYVVELDRPDSIRPLFPPAEGARYGIGHFSPDGRRISYLRRSEGAYVTGVYDFQTGRTIEFDINSEDQAYQYPWISNRTLAVRTSPPGQLAHVVERFVERLDRLAGAWKRSRLGQEPTASAIGSGRYGHIDDRLPAEAGLALLDAETGEVRPLARGEFYYFSASPDGTTLATVRERKVSTGDEARLDRSSGVTRDLVLFDVATGRQTEVCPECNVGNFATAVWSEDSETLVFFAYKPNRSTDADVDFWRYDRSSGAARKVNPDDFIVEVAPSRNSSAINPPRAVWLGDDLVVLGHPAAEGSQASGWYRLRPGQRPEYLTAAFGSATVEMLGSTADGLSALSTGEVWLVDARGGRKLLTGGEPDSVRLWQDEITAGYTPLPLVVVPRMRTVALETRPDDPLAPRRVFALDVVTGRESPTVTVPGNAYILSTALASGRAVYVSEDDGVLTLTLANADGTSRKLLSLNESLASIDRATVVPIEHEDPDGQPIRSFLVLPAGYRPGQRLPTIVSIYPGFVHNRPIRPQLSQYGHDNGQIWTAYGYAYLAASVPMSTAVPRDNADGLAAKVLSAVDAAIAAGYVDPDRVALTGHSFGGWGTLMVISQTNRFKAAVASAAPVNYTSLYGTFDTPDRMTTVALKVSPVSQYETESGQGGMGAPPWEDPDRYVRNSALFNAAAIQTPIMLVQGDLDYVSITEGEQMFTALTRLNRDAIFVRYWGEWHGVASPANIRDLYARRLAWYDEHLDIRRDENGDMLWLGDRAASRAGTPVRDRDWFLAVDRRRAELAAP